MGNPLSFPSFEFWICWFSHGGVGGPLNSNKDTSPPFPSFFCKPRSPYGTRRKNARSTRESVCLQTPRGLWGQILKVNSLSPWNPICFLLCLKVGCSKSQGLTDLTFPWPHSVHVRKNSLYSNYAFLVLVYILAATLFAAGVEPRLLNLLKCKKREKEWGKETTYLPHGKEGRKKEAERKLKRGKEEGEKWQREDRGEVAKFANLSFLCQLKIHQALNVFWHIFM